jgi:hypothetical protein
VCVGELGVVYFALFFSILMKVRAAVIFFKRLYFILKFCVIVFHEIIRLQVFFSSYDSMQGAQMNTQLNEDPSNKRGDLL